MIALQQGTEGWVAFAPAGVITPMLDAAGCSPVETDSLAGLMEQLPPGSLLLMESAAHAFTSLKSFSVLLNLAEGRGIRIKFLAEGLDTGTRRDRGIAKSASILAAFENMGHSEASRSGQEKAARLGRLPGSKPKMTAAQKDEARRLYEEGELTVKEIAARYGVARSAIYRAMRPPEIQHHTGLPPKVRRPPVR